MRKAKPFLAVLTLECLTQNGLKAQKVSESQLQQFLMKKANLSKENASKAIRNLLEDKIIVQVLENKKSGKSNHGSQSIRLCSNDEIEVIQQDYYCFECFLPGELTKCLRCTRVFHTSCARKHPERPNYIVPPANMIDKYGSDEDSRSSVLQQRAPSLVGSLQAQSSNTSSPVDISITQILRPCRVVLERLPPSLLTRELKRDNEVKFDCERKLEFPDVICMGEVRPPTRQRANTSVTPNWLKNESTILSDTLETSIQLCTCCRLLENGPLTQPPNLLRDEMHHLLRYGFKRSRAWIKRDIYKHMEYLKIPKKYFSIITSKLFQRQPIMTLETIENNIKNGKYKLLVDILTDFLELQYVMGVLLGSSSLEFDCSKYAVRDLSYDIAEIKRCPDCYRHSNDRLTPFWFALPCLQRHELVFAKCTGHSFWPAKIVRVFRNGTEYDVRFFGGNHERSFVDPAHTRPIDTLSIKFPKLLSFKKAMDEMQCYQALSQHSPTLFGYGMCKEFLNEIVENVLGAITVDYEKPSLSAKKRKSTKKIVENQSLSYLASMSENEADSEACSSTKTIPNPKRNLAKKRRNSPPKLLRYENSSNVNSPISAISTPTLLTEPINNNNTGTISIEQHIDEMNALREQLRELHQRELTIAKLKSYCVKCLEPAKFLCCIHAWYCSEVCQRQHWYEGHDSHCGNFTIASNGC